MDRKHDRHPRGEVPQCGKQRCERAGAVDVGNPVECGHRVRPAGHADTLRDTETPGRRDAAEERLHQQVADLPDALGRHTLGAEVRVGVVAGREAELRDLIGEYAIDLLGH
ncbi:MAG TPA: hypothetical protein VHJ69_02120, partial [Gemmatimonadales bacterium]|nr:hypothetical protein [Gemmatimonadales bacterium]